MNGDGEIDWKNVDPIYATQYKDKKDFIKMVLMMKDLDYEYPHKLERLHMKKNIHKILDEEERKMREEEERTRKYESQDLTYEEYYQQNIEE